MELGAAAGAVEGFKEVTGEPIGAGDGWEMAERGEEVRVDEGTVDEAGGKDGGGEDYEGPDGGGKVGRFVSGQQQRYNSRG